VESIKKYGVAVVALALMVASTGVLAAAAKSFEELYEQQRPLAEKGDAMAQNIMGEMYDEADDLWSHGEALKWYKLSADQGYAPAQLKLGKKYFYGRGVAENKAEAMRWWRIAADQGYGVAQFMLGVQCATGDGVPEDVVQAYMWFNIIAEKGFSYAKSSMESVAKKMTKEQIAEALRLSREWRPTVRK